VSEVLAGMAGIAAAPPRRKKTAVE
jgi:hypothetical protein